MDDTTSLIILVVLLLVVMFVLPQLLVRRAIPSLIRLFREHKAVGTDNAKTAEELGLKTTTSTQSLFKGRDYKATALQALKAANVIRSTEDGKLFLSEADLANSKWKEL